MAFLIKKRRQTLNALVMAALSSMAFAGDDANRIEGDTLATPTKDFTASVMGSVLPPPIDPSLLPEKDSEGAKYLQQYCTQCHGLPGPGLHTADEWPQVVGRMFKRIDRFSKSDTQALKDVRVPDGDELSTIIHYLARHGYRPIDITNYPDIDTEIGVAFRDVCSQCHALPDPSLHSSDEWRDVVLRMRENMRLLGLSDPGDDAIAKAMSFLQVHAGR